MVIMIDRSKSEYEDGAGDADADGDDDEGNESVIIRIKYSLIQSNHSLRYMKCFIYTWTVSSQVSTIMSSPPQRTANGSVSSSHNANNALDRNPTTISEVCDTPITNNHVGTNSSTQ